VAKLLAAKAAEASGLPLGPLQLDPNVADTCKNGTWSNCGVAIKQQLDRNPANPIDVAELAALWGAAFDAQYDVLRNETATDYDELLLMNRAIEEEIR
jgi:hypothetical protein